ncbi:MAG: hypothetical protein CL609_14775 [Anaerolineaceae bacterium]|nr:hypothetical protein [Anaerolineaceae bacterium]
MSKKIIIVIVVIAILVGGFFGLQEIRKNNAAKAAGNFQTETVSRGNLIAIVGGTGIVRSNQSAQLSWQTSGQIGEINVDLDDLVQEDDLLATLEKNSLAQNIILAEADLVSAKNNLDTLLNSNLAKAQAQQALANAKDALETAETRRESKEYDRASEQTIEEAYARYILAKDEADKWEQRYDTVDNRPEDDPVRAAGLSEWAAAKQVLAQAEANYRYLLTEPDEVEIAIADGNLALAQAQYEEAQREWERLKDGPDPDDIIVAESRIASAEAVLEMANLRAPFNGTITNIYSKTGDRVNPGTVSFRIDDLSRLLVDVEITEVDINDIKTGMSADITFDAILDKTYQGKVVEVARVGNVTAGVVNFTVTIELDNPDENVLPGMTAAVNIIVKEVEDVILVPNRAVRLREGERVIYILRPGEIMPQSVQIEIGAMSDFQSEVVGGDIKVGDTIVINPPMEFSMGPGMGF